MMLNTKMIKIDFIALIKTVFFVALAGLFVVYLAAGIYSVDSSNATLKETSRLYQYKTIEKHLSNIEHILKEIKEK